MKRKPEHILDELLVLQSQAGDRASLSALVRRWERRLWKYARRLTDDAEAADEVTQESWLAIVRGLIGLRDPSRFRSWAYGIVTRKAANWVRDKQRRRRLAESVAEWNRSRKEEPFPEEISEEIQQLQLALRHFPKDRRTLLQLYYQEELSVKEIGEVLRIPEGTVKSRLYHARKLLKEWIKKNRDEKVK